MGRDAPDWDVLPPADVGGTDPPPSKIIIPMAAQAPGYFVTLEGKIYRPFMVDASGRLVVTTTAADGTKIVVVCGGEDPSGGNPPIAVTPAGCLRIGGLGDDGLWHCYATDKQGFFPIAAFRQPSGDLDGIVSSPDGELVVAGKEAGGGYRALAVAESGFPRVAPAYDALSHQYYSADSVGNHADTARWTYTVPAGAYAVVDHVALRVGLTAAASKAHAWIVAQDDASTEIGLVADVWSLTTRQEIYTASPGLVLPAGYKLVGATYNNGGTSIAFRVAAFIRQVNL